MSSHSHIDPASIFFLIMKAKDHFRITYWRVHEKSFLSLLCWIFMGHGHKFLSASNRDQVELNVSIKDYMRLGLGNGILSKTPEKFQKNSAQIIWRNMNENRRRTFALTFCFLVRFCINYRCFLPTFLIIKYGKI